MSSTPPDVPDNLQTGCAVLMVLGVGLQIVDVDVWQTREEQLQLLLIEDGDQPRQKKDDAMLEYEDTILPPGDYVVESLQESTELFPDCSSHLHLTNQLDIISLVVISHLGEKHCDDTST